MGVCGVKKLQVMAIYTATLLNGHLVNKLFSKGSLWLWLCLILKIMATQQAIQQDY